MRLCLRRSIQRSVILIITSHVPLFIQSFIKVEQSGASPWLSMTRKNLLLFNFTIIRVIEINKTSCLSSRKAGPDYSIKEMFVFNSDN
jgi:hypothetical protein